MSELTVIAIAESYASTARMHYERDGHVIPLVAFVDGAGAGVTAMPHRDAFKGDVPEQLSGLCIALGEFVEARYIIVVVEAWSKRFKPEDHPSLERGQLAREADTDADIHTTVMTCAYDLTDLDHSHSIFSQVGGDPRNVEWDIRGQSGRLEGRLADLVLAGYSASKLVAGTGFFPPDQDLKGRLQALAEMNQLSAAMVTETSTPPERNN